MELTGRFVKAFDIQSGTSKSGTEWKKRDFLIETEEGQYSKKICFTVFNHIDLLDGLKMGDLVTVNFSVESREYSGKWYHNINAFGITSQTVRNEPKIEDGEPVAPWYEEKKTDKQEPEEENYLPF